MLRQPRRGYRFNVDALLLADFAAHMTEPPPLSAADLGAGCGVVGLLLARRWPPPATLRLVELQPELAELARHNCRQNGLARRVSVVEADLRQTEHWSDGAVDLVVSNPPFFPRGSGRPSPNPQVARARHELTCTLEQLLAAIHRGLRPGGRWALIFPAHRLAELRRTAEARGLALGCWRPVLPLPGRPANRVLVWGVNSPVARPVERLDELVVERSPGRYTAEARRILRQ